MKHALAPSDYQEKLRAVVMERVGLGAALNAANKLTERDR